MGWNGSRFSLLLLKRAVFSLLLLSVSLIPLMPPVKATVGETIPWYANFECSPLPYCQTSEFDGCWVMTGGEKPQVQTSVVHSGNQAEKDFMYASDGGGSNPHRSYCGQSFNASLGYSSFNVSLWVYVPSVAFGVPVQGAGTATYNGWMTFTGFWISMPDGSDLSHLDILGCTTISSWTDCQGHHELDTVATPLSQYDPASYHQWTYNNLTWPYDQWFGLEEIFDQRGGNVKFTTYMTAANNTHYLLANYTDSLTGWVLTTSNHWGMYVGPASTGPLIIYNDDISVTPLSGSPATTTTTSTSTISTSSVPVWSDNFESYSVNNGGVCNPSIYVGGAFGQNTPSNAMVTPCYSPPHYHSSETSFPEYYQPASSGTGKGQGTVPPISTAVYTSAYKSYLNGLGYDSWNNTSGRYWAGGCVKTNPQPSGGQQTCMGPNSIFAVSEERAHSGVKSIKLGSSDWAYDKTELTLYLNTTANGGKLPEGSTIILDFWIWLSPGFTQSTGNAVTIWTEGQQQLRFMPVSGSTVDWQYTTNPPSIVFNDVGDMTLAVGAWHEITIGVNTATETYTGLRVDGVQPFSSFAGDPAPGATVSVINSIDTYSFGIAVIPGAYNESRYYAGSNSFYAYVDDLSVSYLGTVTTTSTSTSTTLTTFTRPPTSITLSVSPSSVTIGSSVTLSGSISPNPGAVMVTISFGRDSGITWVMLMSVMTDGSGAYSTSWTPLAPVNYLLEASWSGNNQLAPSQSSSASLTVTGSVPPTPTVLLSAPATTPHGQTVTISITVFNPASSGLNANVTIEITGPNNYALFNVIQVKVGASSQSTGYYAWAVPTQTGSYTIMLDFLLPALGGADTENIQVT